METADFSMDKMIADGWIKSENDPVFLLEKKIENINPLNASEDTNIRLVVHGLYNVWTFAVLFPDGGMLNFVANKMEDLKKFEEMISFYDAPF